MSTSTRSFRQKPSDAPGRSDKSPLVTDAISDMGNGNEHQHKVAPTRRLRSPAVLTTVSRELGEELLQGGLAHAEVLQCEALLCIAQSLEIAAVYEASGRR